MGFCILGQGPTLAKDSGRQDKAMLTFFDFVSKNISHANFVFDIDSVVTNKLTPRTFSGDLLLDCTNDTVITLPLKLSARGKYRRKNCGFPPLRLNFPKKFLQEMGLSKFDNYKLVTHCLDGSIGSRLVFKEYLLYKMYALLTNKSFRTHLFPVTYRDLDSNQFVTSYAFLIESNKELEDRLG
ncbi:MAG: hypothetical protein OEQ53_06530, partial [Saprospiraceae bacterium]|nr:hypothetical protein [Saprospiraceae bacterium]